LCLAGIAVEKREQPQRRAAASTLAPPGARPYIEAMARPSDPCDDPRARQLLRTLIARHIRDGEPVGSQTLARHAGLDVSAATIRNILADLEDAGLLSSPHTSAGRVPTAQGYRLFVDSLLQTRPLPEGELALLRQELPAGVGTQALLGSASELLSAMTHFVGVVSAPRREQFAFRHIDFVPLDAQRVLAILVFADNDVQNRIIQTRRAYDAVELERVANYLNHHCAGRPLAEIRATLLHELQGTRSEMEALLAHTIELAEQALVPASDDMVLAGQTRLMGVQELSDLDRLRELFEAFARKREILQLLERTMRAPGVRIFIGEETGLAPLEGVSLVTAPYTARGQILGVVGVIGPTRMAYDRVIPVVQAAADVLGVALDAPG
jgi:heat-inducible transcriptional repressor